MSNKQIVDMELTDITGSKGGGGSPPPETPNTLASRALLKILVLTSEGPVSGLPGDAQAIYFNDTPLRNADGTWNFAHCTYDYRVGYPDQAKVEGFMESAAIVDVNAVLLKPTPVVREVSTADVDAAKVILSLTRGLVEQKDGEILAASVSIIIERRLSNGGAWEQCVTDTIKGKTNSPTQKQYRFGRPAGTGKWQYRVTRVTDDALTSALINNTTVANHVEYTAIDNNYPNCSYVALVIDAEAVGGTIPNISILTKGLVVRVPSNYDPVMRTYSGAFWDGSFKNAYTDNPAWILYDLLTNTRYGMGARGITDDMVDRFSFYDASVYNDGLVPDGKGGQEPRFTFNYPISSREDAWKHLTSIGGAMHCTIIQSRGQIRLSQDRPTDPYMLITKANVSTGEDGNQPPFSYKGTSLDERPTSFNVTFSDREDRNLPRITTVEDQTLINRYGLNISDIAAFGATTEGQAIRHGKWALDTSANQTEIVQFSMGMNGMDLEPGMVVSLWDEDYTDEAGGGRIVSSTSTTFTPDRTISIGTNATVTVMLSDGKTIVTRTIVNNPGTYATYTVTPAFGGTVLPGADFIVKSTISARQFRVISVIQENDLVNIEAVYHDPNKFARIELGINIPSPVFSDTEPSITNAVTGLNARESIITDNDQIFRQLLVSWIPPTQGKAASYTIQWRRENDQWKNASTKNTSFTITDGITPGRYEVNVSAISVFGIPGPLASLFYTIDTQGGQASPLLPVTEIKEARTGSTTEFNEQDLQISFRNPAAQTSVIGTTVRDFQVTIIDPSTSTVLRQSYVAAVPAGQIQYYSYTYADNLRDGGPRRNVTVSIRCRDTSNNVSAATQATFLNRSPAFVGNLAATSGIGNVYVTFTRNNEADFAGVLIWKSTVNGFAPSASNLLFQGDSTFFTDSDVDAGTIYYYKVAAYDTFGFKQDATDLNVGTVSGIAQGYPGVSGGTAFPANPSEGDSFYRSDLKTLYFYRNGVWEQVGIAAGPTLPPTGVDGQQFILTPNNILYIYVTGAWRPITPADGTVTTGSLVAGAVTTAKITAGAVTANEIGASAITAGKIAANAIATNNLQAGVITTDKIGANQITADKILANTITANEIASGAITTVKLAAGAVTADKIQVTSLQAITATMGYLTAGRIDLTADEAGGWGYIRAYNKWYRDGQNGWVFARHANGENFVSIECGPSKLWAYSNGDFGLQGPGFLLTNGGLTINQIDVIGTANIRDANIGTLKLASGASTTMSGQFRDGRQYGGEWNTYAQCGVYLPYGGTVAAFVSGLVLPKTSTYYDYSAGGGEGGSGAVLVYQFHATHARLLINGGQHVFWDDVCNGTANKVNFSGTYAVGVGPGYYTFDLQFYYISANVNYGSPFGVYKASIVAFGSIR